MSCSTIIGRGRWQEGRREGRGQTSERTPCPVTAKATRRAVVAAAAQSPLLFLAKKHAFGIPRAVAAATSPTPLRVARLSEGRTSVAKGPAGEEGSIGEGGEYALSHHGGKRRGKLKLNSPPTRAVTHSHRTAQDNDVRDAHPRSLSSRGDAKLDYRGRLI